MGEKNNYLDKQTDRRLCGGTIWKRGFWIKIGAIVIVTLFYLVLVGSFIYLKGCVSHTLSAIPNGVNISFYDGIDSRGFSWWTEKEQETFLFMSKTKFDAVKVYESRSYTIIEDGSAIKDGIY